jgi:lysine 2,3-aminomutase
MRRLDSLSHAKPDTPAGSPAATRCLVHPRELHPALQRADVHEAADQFAFRVTDYYASLIDFDDPGDPIARLVVPSGGETIEFGRLDASNEAANTVAPGLQHKYSDTALLLVTDQCAGFCRYCFRKRLFAEGNRETFRDPRPALDYIASHPQITDVLLSGGDPLTLSTERLRELIDGVIDIPHVRTIRVGSKMPAYDPSRITTDLSLQELVNHVVESGRSFYLMTHFDHPRELTDSARSALAALRAAGAQCLNQCPVAAGINDDPRVLADLFQSCTDAGAPQYYMFQCRPTTGNGAFAVPIARSFQLVEAARARVSGLSARARFCASHERGKIEVVGLDSDWIYAHYHRAKYAEDSGRMLVFHRDDEACWIDDLVPAGRAQSYSSAS